MDIKLLSCATASDFATTRLEYNIVLIVKYTKNIKCGKIATNYFFELCQLVSMIDDEFYIIIGRNIRYFRKKKGMTQHELAVECIKTDRSKISDMENAKEDFMFSTLLEVCSALSITIFEILTKHNEVDYN